MTTWDDEDGSNGQGGEDAGAIPPGKYRARALGGALGSVGKNETECVEVNFRIVEGNYEGHEINWFGFLTEKSLKITFKALRTMGWKGDDVTDLAGIDENDVQLDIQRETYEGKVQTKVKWVNRLGGFGSSALTADKAKTLAARLKGEAIRSRSMAPPPPKTGPALREKDPPPETEAERYKRMGIVDPSEITF